MFMLRRAGPWLASAALHGALVVAAIFGVARIAEGPPPPDPDASYAVAIRPGGAPRIGETPRSDSNTFGRAQDSVTFEDAPLTGVPSLPLTSDSAVAPSGTPGRGLPGRAYEHGPVAKFPATDGGGGGSPERGSTAGTGVGEGGDDGIEAVPLATPAPVYPDSARRGNVQGTVVAEIRIDAKGRVEWARATLGSGSLDLDAAALQAVKSWRYKPATRGGTPVPSLRRVRFVFKLE